jgi:hypothetical protein
MEMTSMFFETTLKVDAKIQRGVSLLQGSIVRVSHSHNLRVKVEQGSTYFLLPYQRAHLYLNGFIELTEEKLYEYAGTGDSVSPTGQRISILSKDQYGFPSLHYILLRV